MLIVNFWESLEFHSIKLITPVESLLWELISVSVTDTLSDVVVALGCTDPSPEEQLVEVSFTCFI